MHKITNAYILTKIQNEIYFQLNNFMIRKNLKISDVAKDTGVSKKCIKNILNGDVNCSIEQLVDISMYVGKVLSLNFKDHV